MHSDLGSNPMQFSLEDLHMTSQNGSLPPGYLDAYLARMRRLHAAAQAEIDSTLAEAASDPIQSVRLRDLRF